MIALLEDANLREFEEGLEAQVRDLATVEFGNKDVVVVHVKAKLKKEIPPDKTDSLDVGYLPVPYSDISRELKRDISENIESTRVLLMASSLIDRDAMNTFRINVRKLLEPYRPDVTLQVVNPSEPKSRTPASNPEDDKAKAAKEAKDEIGKKDILQDALIVVCLIIIGLFAVLGLRSMGKAMTSSATILGQSISPQGPVQNTVTNEGDALRGGKADTRGPNTPTIDLKECLLQLRKLCAQEPLKLVTSLSNEAGDLVGLKWLLSQLSDQEREQIKYFLGTDRIRELAKPASIPVEYNLGLWAQDLVEKITMKQLEGQAFMEKALDVQDLGTLLQVDVARSFKIAQTKKDSVIWKIALEIISPSYLAEQANALMIEDWQKILGSVNVTSEQVKQGYASFKSLVEAEAKLSGEQVHVDADGESKITDSLLQTLNQMSLGKDEEFIEDLRQSQPRIISAIQEKFWTMPQLRQTDQRALRTFISSQNNEVLFALLLVCPDQDRETLQEMIPEGMKKAVVLDLLKVAQAKNDEQERKVALRVVRETLNRARELHENGRLPFTKDVAT